MKLSPPIIEGTLPAFCGTTISIPFSMNRSVSKADIAGFAVKIKTVQNQNIIYSNDGIEKQDSFFDDGVVSFEIDSKNFKVGQFYKVQLAYYDEHNEQKEVGYYSTVGVIKYTFEPSFEIRLNGQTCLGVYKHSDIAEKVYSYCFNVFADNRLIETSGEIIHDHSKDTEQNQSIDSYDIKQELISGKEYEIEYCVKTINNLESSEKQSFTIAVSPNPIIKASFDCSVDYEDGYVNIDLIINEKPAGHYYLLRASEKDNFGSWNKILNFSLGQNEYEKISLYKDMTIECGVNYKYAIQQYNNYGVKSNKIISDVIHTDFEHAFLYDGERQLKIKYNPKIASFKNTLMESKVDTIGSKYPFIFRNGKVKYKEFSISGLLSYLSDEQSLFMDNSEFYGDIYRQSTKSKIDNLIYASNSLSSLNFQKEKEFKLEVLEWLNNGKPKLFKSPAEGNYIIRLMNVSLSPNDTVGRMLHTFNSTAYEIAENSYENLEKYGFINLENISQNKIVKKEINDLTIYRGNKENMLEGNAISINLIGLVEGDILEIISDNGIGLIAIDKTGNYSLENDNITSVRFIGNSEKNIGGKLIYYKEQEINYESGFDNITNIEIIENGEMYNFTFPGSYYNITQEIDVNIIKEIQFSPLGNEENQIIINGNEIEVDKIYIIKQFKNIETIEIKKGIRANVLYSLIKNKED